MSQKSDFEGTLVLARSQVSNMLLCDGLTYLILLFGVLRRKSIFQLAAEVLSKYARRETADVLMSDVPV